MNRTDFMQLLLELKKSDDGLTIDEVVAQAFLFFFAGYETSSTVMAYCLYELAINPEIQEKVRDEVDTVFGRSEITYDGIGEMKYLQQVVDETLRKYSPVPLLVRQCSNSYEISNENITIDKGTNIIISLDDLHNDPDHYPEPREFDPERFNESNKEKRHPFTFLPFGEGPRNCIGLRFGLLQVKVGLCSLLKNFRFSLTPKTKDPLEMAMTPLTSPQGGIWLDAVKIDQINKYITN